MADFRKIKGNRCCENYLVECSYYLTSYFIISDSGENSQDNSQELKYPRAIPFIIGTEFCERFSFGGLRTILVLYLTRRLEFDENFATILFHIFVFLTFASCLSVGIIADSFIGKFQTILWLSIVYVVGSCLIAAGAVDAFGISAVVFTCVGLLLIGIGSGGIKPCVAAFGAHHFKLPEQDRSLTSYFSMFYFVINLGALLSTLTIPWLRDDVKCFGKDDCFAGAFGTLALFMILGTVLFVCGRFFYDIKPVERNMLGKIRNCIGVRPEF